MDDFETVAVTDLADAPNPTRSKKEIDEAVGATEFGCNLYEADPGERLPWGYHYHPDHEELFYVLDGELAVEIPDSELSVSAGEVLFVPPETPNCARAVGEETARVLAVGAPKDDDGAVIVEECPECGRETDREYESVDSGPDGDSDTEEYVLSCADCGAEVDRFGAGPE